MASDALECALCGEIVPSSEVTTLKQYDLHEFDHLSPVSPDELFPNYASSRSDGCVAGEYSVCNRCWELVYRLVWCHNQTEKQQALRRVWEAAEELGIELDSPDDHGAPAASASTDKGPVISNRRSLATGGGV